MLIYEHHSVMNFIQRGRGQPVICVHGLAASLFDWKELVPALEAGGYAAYALDLLGHGESAKPESRAYHVDWLYQHLAGWFESAGFTQPVVLVGHSLGGYLCLQLARRYPERVKAMVLVSPFYTTSQLPLLLRRVYRRPHLNAMIVQRTPGWIFRAIVDVTSLAMGRSGGHALDEETRLQTAVDFQRTAAGVYNLPNTMADLTPLLSQVAVPVLLCWGSGDQTLAPASFRQMAAHLPQVETLELPAGHVPHQTHAARVNQRILSFLAALDAGG